MDYQILSAADPRKIPFTPVVFGATTAGTYTPTTQQGWYKRSGDVVEFEASVAWTGHTGTGPLRINGVPIGPSGALQILMRQVASDGGRGYYLRGWEFTTQ
ncbi:hypothetical protein [Mesorhizobium kowhaii]|uniref:hypothetical protein n=1 Tax=Mesorhizobium kowhaii TaxID=1300272 RepID=UPI0011B4B703|nr:hypothetical protein [Mesorhizobium kowhaii]